jgi:hypothetical protein
MLIRQFASHLEIDTSVVSKIERGVRKLKKEQISVVAKVLETDSVELETLWLTDQIMELVKNESTAIEAVKNVSKNSKIK